MVYSMKAIDSGGRVSQVNNKRPVERISQKEHRLLYLLFFFEMLANRMGLGLLGPRGFAAGFLRPALSRKYHSVKTTEDQEQHILVEQRKNRPSSPHLTIYQPQLTWYMSSVHRVSGVYLAAGFYALTCSYAFASLAGIPLDSTIVVNWFHSLSETSQYSIKAAAAFPFFFHFANGIRHLIWDVGQELTLKGVYRTGYTVLAFSALVGAYYTFF